MTSTQKRSNGLLSIVVFLVVLHPVLSLYRWLPGASYQLLAFPTVELVALVALSFLSGRLNAPYRQLAQFVAALLCSLLVLFSVGEAFYRYVYQEAFVPWTDLDYLPPFLNMVTQSDLFEEPPAMVGVYALAILAVWFPAYYAVRGVGNSAVGHKSAVGVVVGLTVVALAGSAVDGGRTLTARAAAQLRPPDPVLRASGIPLAAGEVGGGADLPFPVLGDDDLHLLIVESYGHTLFSREDHAEAIAGAYESAEQSLRDAGFTIYSHFLESPAFGGRSWLADATLLTGAFVDTQAKYNELIRSERKNLTHILGEAGYKRVLAAPGTYEADEGWRTFYEYDRYLFRYDFGYEGPFISFGAMPDQYLLYKTHEIVDASRESSPLFVTYVMVSSHVPFDRVPPYIDDVTKLGDGSVYSRVPSKEFDNNWLTGGEYPEGYIAAIRYELRTIAGYCVDLLRNGALVVVVGDHQPRIPIAEAGATHLVPIHVLSTDVEKVRPFRAYGFTAGLVPSDSPRHLRMDRFLPILLDVIEGNAEIRSLYDRNVPK